jgi:hypothetical protein
MASIEVTHAQLCSVIEKAREKSVSVFVEGAPGIGKSETIWKKEREQAKKLNREFRDWRSFTLEDKEKLVEDKEFLSRFYIVADFRGATMSETDLIGFPDFTKSRDYVEFRPRLIGAIFSKPEARGCLLLDELNQAPKNVQNSMFQVVLDRAIGDLKMNDNILVIGAGNRVEDRATITELSGPMASRMIIVTLRIPTADEVIDYNLNSSSPNPVVCGFLKAYRDQVYTFQQNSKDKGFGCPRSIQRLSLLMDGEPMNTEKEMQWIGLLSKASCGEVWGTKFLAYANMARKVDVDEILKNPELVKQHIGQLDVKYSIISTIAYRCKENFKDTMEPALKVFNYLDDESGVFGLRVVKQYVGDAKLKGHLKKSDVWDKHLAPKFANLLGFSDEE